MSARTPEEMKAIKVLGMTVARGVLAAKRSGDDVEERMRCEADAIKLEILLEIPKIFKIKAPDVDAAVVVAQEAIAEATVTT